MVKKAALAFGIVFLLIGVLGFVPGLNPDSHLLGIFHINPVHNLVHLLSGLAAVATGLASESAARKYFQVFGPVYGLVAILGLFTGDDAILGLVANNMADVALHVAIAAAALWLGYGSKTPVTA